MLETQLNYPVMQLSAGRYMFGNEKLHLCVLHPDRIAVFSVTVTNGQEELDHQVTLTKVYQHVFQRHAYLFVTGQFGGVKGRDFMAVLSLDGCISIFEQESFAFTRFIPGFLLPGPLIYIPSTDSFVVASADWALQSFRYQALATTGSEKETSQDKGGGRHLNFEWSQQLSEAAIDMCAVSAPGYPVTIIVLTLRGFFCYKESGVLKFCKKLEYNPSSFMAFYVGNTIQLCITSHTNMILVYHEIDLKWASHIPFSPVAIARANFEGLEGAIAMLNEDGRIQVSYLGTDPSFFVAPPANTREIIYEQTDKELVELYKTIRALDTAPSVNFAKSDSSDLVVTASVGKRLELWNGPTHVDDPDGIPFALVVVLLQAQTPLNAIRVTVNVEKPVAVSQGTFVLRTVCDTSQVMIKFYLGDPFVPSSLSATILTSYISAAGSPRVITTCVDLPLQLVAKPAAPKKEADYKITISSNKAAVNLNELFPEFTVDGSLTSAVGLQYYGGIDVTILSSRTSNRYRLQSDNLAALWLVLKEMNSRLHKYYSSHGRKSDDTLTIGVASSIPLPELLAGIDSHFLKKRKQRDLQAQLMQRATQYRAVQRRLLTKFKDKTPTPLTNLDVLLDGTHKQILQLTEVIDENLKAMDEDWCQLMCLIHLTVELMRLQSSMTAEQFNLVSAALSPTIQSVFEQGWEETASACVTYILRTLLGKGNHDASVTMTEIPVLADTNKLKKHIGLLVEKVTKGGNALQVNQEDTSQELVLSHVNLPTYVSDDVESLRPDQAVPKSTSDSLNEVPFGSRLGEDRARSARVRSGKVPLVRNPQPEDSTVSDNSMSGNPASDEDSLAEDGNHSASNDVRPSTYDIIDENLTYNISDLQPVVHEPLSNGTPDEAEQEPEQTDEVGQKSETAVENDENTLADFKKSPKNSVCHSNTL